jgi:hypothetical protein
MCRERSLVSPAACLEFKDWFEAVPFVREMKEAGGVMIYKGTDPWCFVGTMSFGEYRVDQVQDIFGWNRKV